MRDQAGRVCRPGRAQRGPGGLVPAEPIAPPTMGAEAESRAPRGGRPPGEARPRPPSAAARLRHAGTAPADRKAGQRKAALVSGGVSVLLGEELHESLQPEQARPVGTMPRSLGGPAAAGITDKLTYKDSFYFVSKPQSLTAELPAAEASPAAPARARAPPSRGDTCPGNAKERGGRKVPALAAHEHLHVQEPAVVPKFRSAATAGGQPKRPLAGLPCGHEMRGVAQSYGVCTLHDHTCGPESRGISATRRLSPLLGAGFVGARPGQ